MKRLHIMLIVALLVTLTGCENVQRKIGDDVNSHIEEQLKKVDTLINKQIERADTLINSQIDDQMKKVDSIINKFND